MVFLGLHIDFLKLNFDIIWDIWKVGILMFEFWIWKLIYEIWSLNFEVWILKFEFWSWKFEYGNLNMRIDIWKMIYEIWHMEYYWVATHQTDTNTSLAARSAVEGQKGTSKMFSLWSALGFYWIVISQKLTMCSIVYIKFLSKY